MGRRAACLLLALALLPSAVAAGTLAGVVRNGTTGRPAAGVDVVLLSLQGGMEAVASTQTDAQGRYRFDRPEIGTAPMLVRVIYQKANYHQNLPPGRTTADIEVFEATATQKDLQVASRLLIVQPNGPFLLVGEEYTVHNHSSPPATFAKEFEFRIPEGAELSQVAAWGPAGMPVVQGTTTKGKNHFGVPFPLRPGENGIRISYQMPYVTNQATVGAPALYPVDALMVIAPPTMQVAGPDLRAAGNQEGYNVFTRNAVAANATLQVAVSGTAPPPQEMASSGPSTGSSTGESSGRGGTGQRLQTMPARIHDLQWILLAGLAALFALGTVMLVKKPSTLAAATDTISAAAPGTRGSDGQAAAVAAEMHRAVHHSLDEIKDTLFRLELRRQAGTISEEDYAQQRARAEQTIRELVKG
jgi:hypothetical protein